MCTASVCQGAGDPSVLVMLCRQNCVSCSYEHPALLSPSLFSAFFLFFFPFFFFFNIFNIFFLNFSTEVAKQDGCCRIFSFCEAAAPSH